MLFEGMETDCPAQGFSLQAAVLWMLYLLGCTLQTPWAQFALPVCFSTQHRWESSYPGFCSLLSCCTFPVDADSFARELGKQDFTLFLSLEQKLTNARKEI